ncbi:MAG: PBS lyase, partial [Moorella sp. (in: Bacteria)]|nr:PBS lyase [Moorella sp. (in: firmicutes)]
MSKDTVSPPLCPFCALPIARPEEQDIRRPNAMPVGACSCGAVYACDITGHNLGAAFIEALVYGCNGDWDLAWGLLPEEDYLEKLVENYDYETNLVVPGGAYHGRRIAGALYFIKLQPDILEVTCPGVRKKPARIW